MLSTANQSDFVAVRQSVHIQYENNATVIHDLVDGLEMSLRNTHKTLTEPCLMESNTATMHSCENTQLIS